MQETLIGVSPNILRVQQLIRQIADTGLSTLVCGKTGVGKELVVKQLYQRSDCKGGPFIKVNCAALPDTLLESEMFGYERGAFTGAQRKMRGKFEQAKGGVLFLDEIGDMSLSLQSKLLHALQDGEFIPLGSEKTVKSNAWVIAATNHDLEEELRAGKFRKDLYYRISTIKIYIDPLHQRPEDIPPLIDHYLKKYACQLNGKFSKTLSQTTIDKLMRYHWPGNVRELQNVIRRILVLGEEKSNIDEVLSTPAASAKPREDYPPNGRGSILTGFLDLNRRKPDLSELSLKKFQKQVSDQVEKDVISYVLEKTGWNRSTATQILKVSYKTLLTKIQELEIRPPENLA
jgi:transcriptional regulator with PAS, ATPase and Fis domain